MPQAPTLSRGQRVAEMNRWHQTEKTTEIRTRWSFEILGQDQEITRPIRPARLVPLRFLF